MSDDGLTIVNDGGSESPRFGIGAANPATKLDVEGTTKTTGLQVSGGTIQVGHVLTSDDQGNATWQAPTGGGGGGVAGTLQEVTDQGNRTTNNIQVAGLNVCSEQSHAGGYKLNVDNELAADSAGIARFFAAGKRLMLSIDVSKRAAQIIMQDESGTTPGIQLRAGERSTFQKGIAVFDDSLFNTDLTVGRNLNVTTGVGNFGGGIQVDDEANFSAAVITDDTLDVGGILTANDRLIARAGITAGASSSFNALEVNTNLIVAGSTESQNVAISNQLSTLNLQVTGGIPTVGHVLTSDALGNATWQAPAGNTTTPNLQQVTTQGSSTTDNLSVGGINVTGRSTFSGDIIARATLNLEGELTVDDAATFTQGIVGQGASRIDTLTITQRLTTPNLATSALQVTGGIPTSGHVLTSDALGNATWQAPVDNSRVPSLDEVATQGNSTTNALTLGGLTVGDTATFTRGITAEGSSSAENLAIGANLSTPALQVTGGIPTSGHVLTSDSLGNATWQAPVDNSTVPSLDEVTTQGSSTSNTLTLGGLTVDRTLATSELQVTGGIPTEGHVLTSDTFGNATWQAPVAESLQAVTDNGNTTTNSIEVGGINVNGSATLMGGFNAPSSNTAGSLTVDSTLATAELQVTGGIPTAGHVLTSDSLGNATWQAPVDNSTVPSLDEVTTQGNSTTNSLAVGGLSVSNTATFAQGIEATGINRMDALAISQGLSTPNLVVSAGFPAEGNILTSDLSGNASWQPPVPDSLQAVTTAGSSTIDTIRVGGIDVSGSSTLTGSVEAGASLTVQGEFTANEAANLTKGFNAQGLSFADSLMVNTELTTPTLQVTGGIPTEGHVLTSDALGNATWQAPTGGGGGTAGTLQEVTDQGAVTTQNVGVAGLNISSGESNTGGYKLNVDNGLTGTSAGIARFFGNGRRLMLSMDVSTQAAHLNMYDRNDFQTVQLKANAPSVFTNGLDVSANSTFQNNLNVNGALSANSGSFLGNVDTTGNISANGSVSMNGSLQVDFGASIGGDTFITGNFQASGDAELLSGLSVMNTANLNGGLFVANNADFSSGFTSMSTSTIDTLIVNNGTNLQGAVQVTGVSRFGAQVGINETPTTATFGITSRSEEDFAFQIKGQDRQPKVSVTNNGIPVLEGLTDYPSDREALLDRDLPEGGLYTVLRENSSLRIKNNMAPAPRA